MSLKTFFVSTLLAASALAVDFNGNGGSSSGSGSGYGSYGSESSMGGGMSSWSSTSQAAPPALAAATTCPSGCVPIPTGSAPMQTQPGQLIVQVVSVSDANGSLKYFPNNIQAPVGSIVQFQYHPKNHTITESSFAEPCKPLAANLTSPTRPGLKSGFVPVTGMEPFTPVFNVLVNDTKPIWIYCGQTNHCAKGMAMVINQNNSSPNTIDAYIAKAAQLPLVNVTAPAPPAGSPPPAGAPPSYTSAPPAAPPAVSSPPPFGAPPAGAPPAETSSSFAPPPAIATIAPATSTVGVAPATFTGAAVPAFVAHSSTGVFGLVLGVLLAMW